ncbi:Hypothetical predicted protein [Pelobates cultripes]|uniref:Uncharacterized protein n=1 Tax=Pelobates cultripes TaxID=61616 RepID=A0AAD1W842_PELCU|nr:Hypothetical predicted protein [Pelobates cultripes]
MIMAEVLEEWEAAQRVPLPATINFAAKHSSLTAEPTIHVHSAVRQPRRGNKGDTQQQAILPLTNLQRHKCGRPTLMGLQPKATVEDTIIPAAGMG